MDGLGYTIFQNHDPAAGELNPLCIWLNISISITYMEKEHRIKRVLFWGTTIVLAWLLGRIVVWNVIKSILPHNSEFYYPKISLFGLILFLILSIALSAIRDKKYSNDFRKRQDSAILKTNVNGLELLTFATRLSLVGFISVFWFKLGDYWWNAIEIDSNVGSNLFAILLALGIGTALIAIISGYMIIFEPWRILIIRCAKQNDRQYRYLTHVGRFSSILLANVFHFIYFIPGLNSKLPSVISSIVVLLIILYYQITISKNLKS